MKIDFANQPPEYCAATLTVSFPAQIDGRAIDCAISVEALEDHFEVESTSPDGWLKAFARGRTRIEQVAREHLERMKASAVLLRSGHFPPGSALHRAPIHLTTLAL